MRPRATWVIVASVFVAAVLAVLRLPDALPDLLGRLRPDWVSLVVLYWVLALPHRVGVLWGWTCGLLLDVLLGWPLGLHAATLATLAWLAGGSYKRLRMYALAQQAGFVFLAVLLMASVHGWVLGFTRPTGWTPWVLATALASAVAWPPLFLLLRGLRRRFRVN